MTTTTTTETEFNAALAAFVADAQALINAHFAKHYPTLTPDVLSVDPGGRRYVRVVKSSGGSAGRSVYCFVERATGFVLKADSWKRPAKGVRGSIFEPAGKSVSSYGAHYAR